MITEKEIKDMTTKELSILEKDLYQKVEIMENKGTTNSAWYKEVKKELILVSEELLDREDKNMDNEKANEFAEELNRIVDELLAKRDTTFLVMDGDKK